MLRHSSIEADRTYYRAEKKAGLGRPKLLISTAYIQRKATNTLIVELRSSDNSVDVEELDVETFRASWHTTEQSALKEIGVVKREGWEIIRPATAVAQPTSARTTSQPDIVATSPHSASAVSPPPVEQADKHLDMLRTIAAQNERIIALLSHQIELLEKPTATAPQALEPISARDIARATENAVRRTVLAQKVKPFLD